MWSSVLFMRAALWSSFDSVVSESSASVIFLDRCDCYHYLCMVMILFCHNLHNPQDDSILHSRQRHHQGILWVLLLCRILPMELKVLLTWGCSSLPSLGLVFLDVLFEGLCLLLVDMFSKDYVVCKDNMVSTDCLVWFVKDLEFVLQAFEILCLIPGCRVYQGDLRDFPVR